MAEGITEIFVRLAELAQARGDAPISKFAGCWEGVIGDGLQFAVNGHRAPTVSTIAPTPLPPFHAIFMRDGWPIALVSPGGGIQMGEGSDVELMIIAFLKEAIVAAGGTPAPDEDLEAEEPTAEQLELPVRR